MAPQQFSPSLPLSSTDIQNEIERLFSEVERMIDYTESPLPETPPSLHYWAYSPPDAVAQQEETNC